MPVKRKRVSTPSSSESMHNVQKPSHENGHPQSRENFGSEFSSSSGQAQQPSSSANLQVSSAQPDDKQQMQNTHSLREDIVPGTSLDSDQASGSGTSQKALLTVETGNIEDVRMKAPPKAGIVEPAGGYHTNPPPKDRAVRVYADGVFDLFHLGYVIKPMSC